MRKPHARSKLKTLPPERQRELYEYLTTHTLAEAEAWLAVAEIDTNPSSLSEFFAWYPLASRMHAASNMGETVKDLLRELPHLNLNEDQLSKAGQAIFEAEAIADKNSKLFVSLRSLRQTDKALDLKAKGDTKKAEQKDRDLSIAERRVKLLEENAKQAKDALTRAVAKGGMTPEALAEIEAAAKLL